MSEQAGPWRRIYSDCAGQGNTKFTWMASKWISNHFQKTSEWISNDPRIFEEKGMRIVLPCQHRHFPSLCIFYQKKNTSAVFQLAALKSQHWFFECFDIPRPFSNYCESSKWSKQTKDAQLITRLRHSFLTVVLFTCMFSKNIEKRSVGFVDLCYQSEIRIRKFLKSLRAVDYQHQETEANQNELSLRRLLSFVQSILRI